MKNNEYKNLPELLHNVRWMQHLLSIVAEILILLSFAISGMDISLGGGMARISWLAWIWGGAFALGIDTSFVIAWVRVRQSAVTHNWNAFFWNLLLAIGMSFIVFQPVAIQTLQQSLGISFADALNQLGINLIILVYARALVAVLLGAILAMTNVESAMVEQRIEQKKPKRRVKMIDDLLNRYAPVEQPEQQNDQIEQVIIKQVEQEVIKPMLKPQPTPLSIVHVEVELTPLERVEQALLSTPNCSDRELGRLTGMAAATAKKLKNELLAAQQQAV